MRRIDAHTHMIGDHPQVHELLDSYGLKLMNISVPDDKWAPWRTTEHPHYERIAKAWPQRFAWCTSFDVPGTPPAKDYCERQIAYLERDFKNGAVAVKLYYNIGETVKRVDGGFLQMDDPLFDPIFQYLLKRQAPVVWHHGGSEEARHKVIERYRGLRFIGAHLGYLPDCLVTDVSKSLDRHPNFAVDTAATVRRLLKQDVKDVRAFFERYQDRILFGTDLGAFEEMVSYSFVEMAPEKLKECMDTLRVAYKTQFAYYEQSGPMTVFEWGHFPGEGLGLSEAILEKVYLKNALHWIPGLA